MSEHILFEEKQYLGFNKQSILWRIVLALFCFVAYYWSENPKPVDVSGIHIGSYPVQDIENSGQIFFVMGMIIMVISAILIFVLHMHTTVTEQSIILDGLWTARKVKIDFSSIVSAEKVLSSKYRLNRPMYNLHLNGTIRFYTRGKDSVQLTDRDGLKYRIGTQRADDLLKVIQQQLNK
jgi:hypothetical protein